MVVVPGLRMIPGDPARVLAGTEADAAGIEAVREKYGLGDPIPIQYLRWVALALRGDLGHSIRTRESVIHIVGTKLPITIELAFLSLDRKSTRLNSSHLGSSYAVCSLTK